jgi:hypothetical protein
LFIVPPCTTQKCEGEHRCTIARHEKTTNNAKTTFHAPESARECEGMNPHIPNELPLWELESQCIPKFLENNGKGQNSLD